MEPLPYKVEMQGSLWHVTLRIGAYSDACEEHYLFSGNDESEVWEFMKIWASNVMKYSISVRGMAWSGNLFTFSLADDAQNWLREEYHDNFSSSKPRRSDWYWDVEIKRAEVIYVRP